MKFIMVILFFALFATSAYAVKINEIMYNPTGADLGYEWIELYNGTEDIINLKDYSFEIAGSNWNRAFIIEQDISLAEEEFMLICEREIVGCDYYIDKIGMQNGGGATDGIRIKNENGAVTDTFLYDTPNINKLINDFGDIEIDEKIANKCLEGNSLGRKVDGNDNENLREELACFVKPTPRVTNQQINHDNMFSLSEIFPYKEDGYIEIIGSTQNLENWYLKDNLGERAFIETLYYNVDISIAAYPFSDKEEGCVYLHSPDDKIQDSLCFSKPILSVSFCKESSFYCYKSQGEIPNKVYPKEPSALFVNEIDLKNSQYVKITAKAVLEKGNYIYFEIVDDSDIAEKIFRIEKDKLVLDIDYSSLYLHQFEIVGFWYSYEEYKYQIYPTSVKSTGLISNGLAQTGEGTFFVILLCIFLLYLVQ